MSIPDIEAPNSRNLLMRCARCASLSRRELEMLDQFEHIVYINIMHKGKDLHHAQIMYRWQNQLKRLMKSLGLFLDIGLPTFPMGLQGICCGVVPDIRKQPPRKM